ncbi:MAG TPA: glycosyltransferase family 2 protein [Kiloniellaceae bacterium]|nr:glycosyltransferase family 2 protein [Kiloniellaceae bacterium]
MKLIVQIPCHNEKETLQATLADIPRSIAGIGQVEVLVIDDGSTDQTAQVARALGADHVVRHIGNKGLARAFASGIDACLRHGADIIVNTDGDNQYCGTDIARLVDPILEGRADIVVGDRGSKTNPHFSIVKKGLQLLGSAVVRRVSGIAVPDAVSGFRAISREAALQLNIVSPFSYTIEMLIQAGRKQMAVASVPVRTNGKTRESRLFGSIPQFLERSLTTMVRMYSMFRPLKLFFAIGLALSLAGAAPIIRFAYYYLWEDGGGHIQSLVLGGVLLIIGFVTFMIGLVADLISFNRQLVEIALEKIRRIEMQMSIPDDSDAVPGRVTKAEAAVPKAARTVSRDVPCRATKD